MFNELILTGIRELWPECEDTSLFLGPFCFVYNDNHSFLDYDNFHIVDDPWKCNHKLVRASKHLDNLYDRLLPSLSSVLNKYYNTRFTDKFWEISTISYLVLWLGAIYDRFIRLKMAEESIPSTSKLLVRIINNPTALKVEELTHWFQVISTHEYNLYLISQIIQEGSFPKFNIKSVDINIKLSEHSAPQKISSSNEAAGIDIIQRDIYLGSIWALSEREKELVYNIRPYINTTRNVDWDEIKPKYNEDELSSFSLSFKPQDEFESIVKSL